MSAPEQRHAANKMNSQKSTGPATLEGKAVASRNATRHGVLSAKHLLEDEAADEFDALMGGLVQSLNPVGALEVSIVERIAITLWRQRRLVHAETATLMLARQPKQIAAGVSSELERRYDKQLQPEDLEEFDEEHVAWCQAVIAEIERLDAVDLKVLESQAPLAFEQIRSDSEDVGDPEAFLASHKGLLNGYLAELLLWCRGRLQEAEERPQVLELAKQMRATRLVLPAESLELMSRYQSTLDNQLYKALRALRDAQEWRLKTLEWAADASECEATAAVA